MTIQDPLRAWLQARDPNAFLTFNFGYAVNQLDGDRQIKHFFNVVQRNAYGRGWSKHPAEDRIEAVGVWEHLELPSAGSCHKCCPPP